MHWASVGSEQRLTSRANGWEPSSRRCLRALLDLRLAILKRSWNRLAGRRTMSMRDVTRHLVLNVLDTWLRLILCRLHSECTFLLLSQIIHVIS